MENDRAIAPEGKSTSFRTVWAVLDQAKYKARRVRDGINYLVDGSMEKKEDCEKPEDPIPSINTLQAWAEEIDITLTGCEKLVQQLRGNS